MSVDQAQFDNRVPFAQWEVVSVTFATPGADVDITHSLSPAAASDIRYIPLKQSAAGSIYEDTTGTRKTWRPGLIYLRASAALSADLLLVVLSS